eukprot:1888166-Rhodomonas_salina.1
MVRCATAVSDDAAARQPPADGRRHGQNDPPAGQKACPEQSRARSKRGKGTCDQGAAEGEAGEGTREGA